LIERLKQTSTDGFLFSGLICNNELGDRSKAIEQRYGQLKRKLGFTDKVHSFHSFRSTLATQLLNEGVPLEFATRIIGHSNPEGVKDNLTSGHYTGELKWKNKVEAMAKVKYK
jgi:site-specific recombinase XerD